MPQFLKLEKWPLNFFLFMVFAPIFIFILSILFPAFYLLFNFLRIDYLFYPFELILEVVSSVFHYGTYGISIQFGFIELLLAFIIYIATMFYIANVINRIFYKK